MVDFNDPLDAAQRRMFPQRTPFSFFPAVNQRLFADNDRGGLLQDINDTFYGGGHANPTPTPTPTPSTPSYFGGAQFQNQTAFQPPPRRFMGLQIPKTVNPWDEWQKRYGFTV